jgi:hypothetical protein
MGKSYTNSMEQFNTMKNLLGIFLFSFSLFGQCPTAPTTAYTDLQTFLNQLACTSTVPAAYQSALLSLSSTGYSQYCIPGATSSSVLQCMLTGDSSGNIVVPGTITIGGNCLGCAGAFDLPSGTLPATSSGAFSLFGPASGGGYGWRVPTADAAGAVSSNGSGQLSVTPIGTSANNLVKLDGSAKLPAVDGSQLTNLPIGSQTPWASNINAAGYTLDGNSTSAGNLTLDSTSNATKGYVLLNPTGSNVGIGTTVPGEKLSVGYGINNDVSIGTATNNKFYFGTYNDGVGLSINRRSSDGVFANVNEAHAEMDMVVGNANSYISFLTTSTNNVIATERMRIDKNGNVGIGTTSPGVKLDVNGDVTVETGASYTNQIVCYLATGKLGHMTQSALLAGAGSAACVAN